MVMVIHTLTHPHVGTDGVPDQIVLFLQAGSGVDSICSHERVFVCVCVCVSCVPCACFYCLQTAREVGSGMVNGTHGVHDGVVCKRVRVDIRFARARVFVRISCACFCRLQAVREVGSGMVVEQSGRAPRLEMVSFKKLNKGTLLLGVVFKVSFITI